MKANENQITFAKALSTEIAAITDNNDIGSPSNYELLSCASDDLAYKFKLNEDDRITLERSLFMLYHLVRQVK
jgi:hypothetical protein